MSKTVGRTNLTISETIKINDALKGRLKFRHTRDKDGVKVFEYAENFNDEAIAKLAGTTVYKVAFVRLNEYGELLRGDEGSGGARTTARIEALESEQRLTTERLLDAAKAVEALRDENKALRKEVQDLADLVTKPAPKLPFDPNKMFNGQARPAGR
jgi:hypothetical protein